MKNSLEDGAKTPDASIAISLRRLADLFELQMGGSVRIAEEQAKVVEQQRKALADKAKAEMAERAKRVEGFISEQNAAHREAAAKETPEALVLKAQAQHVAEVAAERQKVDTEFRERERVISEQNFAAEQKVGVPPYEITHLEPKPWKVDR
jgi:hypothetical protein